MDRPRARVPPITILPGMRGENKAVRPDDWGISRIKLGAEFLTTRCQDHALAP
jgi:hypothetical protein